MIFGSGSWETLEDLTGVYSKTFGDPKVNILYASIVVECVMVSI